MMGRKRSFNRRGPGGKKKRKKNLVEINKLAKNRIQREQEKRKLDTASSGGGILETVKDKLQLEFDSSSESEPELSAYDKLLDNLKGDKRTGSPAAQEDTDESSEEDGEGAAGGGNIDDDDDLDEGSAAGSEAGSDVDLNDDLDDDLNTDLNASKEGSREAKGNLDEVEDNSDDDDDDDDEVKDNMEYGMMGEEDRETIGNKENTDPYYSHFHTELTQEEVDGMKTKGLQKLEELRWPELGCLVRSSNCGSQVCKPTVLKGTTHQELHIRKRLFDQWPAVNGETVVTGSSDIFSPLQRELFSTMHSYMDLMYPGMTHENAVEVRNAYCLHILNHVVKNRMAVHKHNNLLASDTTTDADDMRDQGLTRPKVLIVVPFRHTLLQIVNTIIDLLLPKGSQHVSHRKRFNDEFGDKYSGAVNPNKPEDWQKTFAGNIDDHFKIGIALSKKSLKLYAPFYQADIIISSPLGLRTIIGSKGDRKQDFDFLSSIEILVMEQTDVFMMQNWEHVLHLLDYMHLQPKESHGVDFSRVRMWALSGWNQFYRQTLLFSRVASPEIKAVMNKYCRNFSGQLCVSNPTIDGSICQVATQLQQVFQRIKVDSFLSDSDERFTYFTTKVLPQYKDSLLQGTMIFVPSYFDYVRIRNHFRKEDVNFCQISEYSQHSDISRVRQYLIKAQRHFLLYTERFHFFHRIKLRAVHHIIFYQPPMYPHFYSEMCNMLQNSSEVTDITCQVLFTKYDVQRISRLVGTKKCSEIIKSPKDVHVLISGGL